MTRREFLLGAAGTIVVGALSSSCGRQPEQVDKTSVIASPEPTPTKIPTIEPAPTREVIGILGTTITEEYLRNAFVGVGGGERVGEGQAETSLVEFGLDYVSKSWGETIKFTHLPEKSVDPLKYLVSLGAYRGEEGFFAPGKQGGEVIFPQLAELSLARLTLSEVPSEAEQEASELKEWITPRSFLLRSGTQMTVVGLLNEPKPSTEITIDKNTPGGELNSVLVAFTDYLRTSGESGVPRHYLALLPTHFPADPENRNALSLENLLVANGYQFDSQSQQIVLNEGQKETRLNLNQIEGEALIAEIRKEVGMVFVDQINGEMIKNPIVPHFEEMPAVWDFEETVDEEGRTSFILKSQDQETGDFKNLAQAKYNIEQGEWKWERIFSPEELLAKAPSVEGLILGWEEEKVIYRAEKDNPYNLQEGEYAGYLFEFDDETGTSSGQGLALASEVRRKLLEKTNTSEAIEKDQWRMAFNFDPRGERIKIWEEGSDKTFYWVEIGGLPSTAKFRSPFIEQTRAIWSPQRGFYAISIDTPENLLEKHLRGANHGLSFLIKSAQEINLGDWGARQVSFDEIIFTEIEKEGLFSRGISINSESQIIFTASSLMGPHSFSLERILRVDQALVFSLDRDQ